VDIRRVTERFSQQSVCNAKVNCGDYTKCMFTLPFGRKKLTNSLAGIYFIFIITSHNHLQLL